MRCWMLAMVLSLASLAFGADNEEARRAEVNAATTEAFSSLRNEVLAVPLGDNLTIGRLVARAEAAEQLDAALQSAEVIGGTRWLDDQTVEVRMEIHGGDLIPTIEAIAKGNPKLLPFSPRVLHDRLHATLDKRAMSGVGMSTAATAADKLRPGPAQVAWRGVSDKDRCAAIDAARAAAVDRLLASLALVDWDYGKRHLADVLSAPGVEKSLRQWLEARPITSIEFRDDLEVRISLAAAARDLWPTLRDCVTRQSAVSAPRDQKEWDALKKQVETHMAPASGVALARAQSAPGAGPAVELPVDPPPWVSDTTETDAVSAPVGDNKLRTARAAEAAAREKLRAKLNALPLTGKMTLGEAAARDPKIAGVLEQSVREARIAKVDYDSPAPGFVMMHLSLDLQIVWARLGGR